MKILLQVRWRSSCLKSNTRVVSGKRILLSLVYLWRGIMDKNVLRSFCVVHYIVPAVMCPVMLNTTRCATVSHPICRFIVTLMPLHRTVCCYIVLGDAISYRSSYYMVPYVAISYTVMLYRTAHAITSYRMLLYRTR